MVADLRKKGLSNRQVAIHLNAEGIPPVKGGLWTRNKVQNLIYKPRKQPQLSMTREESLAAWGRRPGFNDPYGRRKH